jgi:hypothetical protein
MPLIVAVETNRRTNIGTILRCAVAFGADAMVIIGSKKYSTHGAHGAQSHVTILHFYDWFSFRDYAKLNGFTIYGVSSKRIPKETVCVEDMHFHSSIAFIACNKTDTFTNDQMQVCDGLLHVPFPTPEDLSINVHNDLKLSICLERFAVQMNAIPVERRGEKFVLDYNMRRTQVTVRNKNIAPEFLNFDLGFLGVSALQIEGDY